MNGRVSWAYISDGRGRMGGDESARKWGGELGGQKRGGRKYGSKVLHQKSPKNVPKEPRKRWSGGKKPVKIR